MSEAKSQSHLQLAAAKRKKRFSHPIVGGVWYFVVGFHWLVSGLKLVLDRFVYGLNRFVRGFDRFVGGVDWLVSGSERTFGWLVCSGFGRRLAGVTVHR